MEAGKLLKKGLTRIIPGQSHLNVIGTGSQPNSGSVELLFCLSRKNRKSNLVDIQKPPSGCKSETCVKRD